MHVKYKFLRTDINARDQNKLF